MSVQVTAIPLSQTKQFSSLIIDYLNGNNKLKSFYQYPPTIDSFAEAIQNKKKQAIDRNTLVHSLLEQYLKAGIKLNSEVQKNIDSLLSKNTFTITTGHQLALFTGPLYLIYKIISVINTTKQLRERYTDSNFVPVFWLASEDHDLEEINHIHLFGKSLSCDLGKSMPAGVVSTTLVEPMLKELKIVLGESENAQYLFNLFSSAYASVRNLSDATRYILHELFKEDGLVIIDGNNRLLKQQFSFIVKDELEKQTTYKIVGETNKKLELHYKIQAQPRNVNLFFIDGDKRKRIVSAEEKSDSEKGIFINETLPLVNSHPEKFSPNVLLRPLYQEIILPNLAYIGGPAEVAYWLELKALFEYHKIPYPIVMMRNSALFMDERSSRFNLESSKWFDSTDNLINEYVRMNAGSEISLVQERQILHLFYKELEEKVSQVDITLSSTVKAEKTKHVSDLEKLEQKLIKAEKRKHETAISQIKSIKEKMFPNGVIQERHENFMPLYIKHGENFFSILKTAFNPFNVSLTIFI